LKNIIIELRNNSVEEGEMKNNSKIIRRYNKNESGAALATVMLVSVLLLTAIIALLSAASKQSRNVTDVLSETKAYYAAESGLQATVNVLRNDSTMTYGYADSHQTLSDKLSYNYPISGTADRVVIGEDANTYNPNVGTAYSIFVEDPDNSSDSLTFYTSGVFLSFSTAGKYTISNDYKTIYICDAAPCDTATTRTEYSFTDAANTNVNFLATHDNPRIGSFTKTDVNGGVDIGTDEIKFRIDYHISLPRSGLRNMRGSIKKSGSNFNVTFQSQNYELLGSNFELCSGTSGGPNCADVTLTLTSGTAVPFYAYMTPIEPYRLRVLATGYGPNGAKKQLEAFIQKNFFNDFSSPAPLMMQGPGAQLVFDPGNSAQFEINGVDSDGIVVPSVGVIDQTGLNSVNDGSPTCPQCLDNIQPAPAIVTDVPDWMATPQNLDTLISQLRQTAINSGRYLDNPTSNLTSIGDYDIDGNPTGTGITFCEGDCTAGVDGGGILVVTGQLTNVGDFDFKGLIIVTGAGGWLRNGGGQGTLEGNIIISPYTSADLSSNTFSLSPRYEVTGGGTSDITYGTVDFDTTFNGTKSISNFMLGVSEK